MLHGSCWTHFPVLPLLSFSDQTLPMLQVQFTQHRCAEEIPDSREEEDLLSLLSYGTQDHLHLRSGTVHSGWALLHQPLIKKMPHRLSQGHSDGCIFSFEVFFSQILYQVNKLTSILLHQHTFTFLSSTWNSVRTDRC